MDTKTKSTRMAPLLALYDMHTDYYKKGLAGISDSDRQNRLDTKANHVAWIAGSVLQERYEMLNTLTGAEEKQEADGLFCNHQGIKDEAVYPELKQFCEDWDKISPKYRKALEDITDEKLDSTFEMEGMKMSHYELVLFMTYREANMIGQIALWRRLLGYTGIKYD